jgi:hypothetical protein
MFSLAIQSFGREGEYKRAILAVLSFFSWYPNDPKDVRVILFTDRPEYFSDFFNGLTIQYVLLTPEKIIAMRGNIDFLHRMKIALIEEAFSLSNGSLLYADSDTFFIADPTPLMKELTPVKSFMHEWEYTFEAVRNWALPTGKSFRDFLSLIESKTFTLSDGSEMNITPNHSSWNAGVMMFHASHARFIPDVYALTEQFYPPSKNHASEQYAFSIILQENTKVSSCEAISYHYWYRVKKQIIDEFLSRKLNNKWKKLPLERKIAIVKEWSLQLPGYFKTHEWMIKDHAIQAFNENRFSDGYRWTAKALLQKPLSSGTFLKDAFYHFKRHITNK